MILSGLTLSARVMRLLVIMAATLPLAGISSFEALFAPKAELWPRWQVHDASSTAQIDHAAWSSLLERYLKSSDDGVNRFDYARVSDEDQAALQVYIDSLTTLPIDSYNRSEQLAYWINLYNALTVQVVLTHYPVESIRDIDISPGWFSDGPWDKSLVVVAEEELSLNDIEHRILRPIWRDPRIHYAVNCASIGCPNLQPTAFTGSNAEELLEKAAREYVNSSRGVRISDNGLIVSSIYVWFQEDFGDDAAVITHLAHYAEPRLAAMLLANPTITDHDYNWRLNDASNY